MSDKYRSTSFPLVVNTDGALQFPRLKKNQLINLSRSYITGKYSSVISPPTPSPPPSPKETDPRKLFDRVIKRMEYINEMIYDETQEFMCDCDCKCTGPCEYDRNGVCIQHTVPYEYIQRVYINPAYNLMDYKKRLVKKKEHQEKMKREKAERDKIKALQVIEKMVEQNLVKVKMSQILDAIRFIEEKKD